MGMDAARITQAVNASIEQVKQWISPLTIIKKSPPGVILNHAGGGFLLLVGDILHDIAYITLQNAAENFDGVGTHALVAL